MLISIIEHEKLYIGKNLNVEKNIITQDIAIQLRQFEIDIGKNIFYWSRNSFSPKQWVGIIPLKQVTIEILPKISNEYSPSVAKHILIKMLLYTKNQHVSQNIVTNLAKTGQDLSEIIITIFLNKLKKVLTTGLVKSYIKREKNQSKLKGKIMFNKQIKYNLFHQERFYCKSSEQTYDNDINQIIKYTLFLLKKRSRNSKNLYLIKHLDENFNGVLLNEKSQVDIDKINWTRLNVRFKEIIEYCSLFLNQKFLSFQIGSEKAEYFLFDMNSLFEKVIYNSLKKAYKNVSYQYNRQYLLNGKDGSKKIKLKPDIILNYENHQIILDTKWKKMNSFIQESDAYQMYVYGHIFPKVSKVVLLYPKVGNNDRIKGEYQFANHTSNISLEIKTVDLVKLIDSKNFHKYIKTVI